MVVRPGALARLGLTLVLPAARVPVVVHQKGSFGTSTFMLGLSGVSHEFCGDNFHCEHLLAEKEGLDELPGLGTGK